MERNIAIRTIAPYSSCPYVRSIAIKIITMGRNIAIRTTLAKECFTANDLSFANRPKFPSTSLSSYKNSTIGSSPYGPAWRDMRRIAAAQLLSGHHLSFFAHVRADEAKALARKLFLDSTHEDFKRVELRPRLFGLSMNVMMKMMVGKRYDWEEEGNEAARCFKELVEEGLIFAGPVNIGDFLPSVVGRFAQRRVQSRLAENHVYCDSFMQAIIDERRRKIEEEEEEEEAGNYKIMIDAIFDLEKQHDDTYIKSLIKTLLSAGSDTSANIIEWAMSLLLNHPEKLEKVRKEIDEKIKNGHLLKESDLSDLPYLNCVINETLRMYPAAPLLVPHESLEECKVGGYNIPIGTMLLVNAYVIQRDPTIWVEPAKFVPERFVEDNKMEGGHMIVFGMGRRRCPGEGLAMREVGLVLGTLVQCFEWRRVGLKEVDMEEGWGLTMSRSNQLEAMCKPRGTMIATLAQL